MFLYIIYPLIILQMKHIHALDGEKNNHQTASVDKNLLESNSWHSPSTKKNPPLTYRHPPCAAFYLSVLNTLNDDFFQIDAYARAWHLGGGGSLLKATDVRSCSALVKHSRSAASDKGRSFVFEIIIKKKVFHDGSWKSY